jgi:hypothetical protein
MAKSAKKSARTTKRARSPKSAKTQRASSLADSFEVPISKGTSGGTPEALSQSISPECQRAADAYGASRKRGRPASLTLDLVEQIAEKIGKGVPEKYACLLFGVSLEAFNKAKQRKPEFLEAVEVEKAVFIDRALDHIAMGGPSASGHRWILQTRHKEFFGLGDGINIINENTNVNAAILTAEDQKILQTRAREMFLPKGGN